MADRNSNATTAVNLTDLSTKERQDRADVLVNVDELSPGAIFEVRTQNRIYRVEYCGNGHALIVGHPQYCPEPVLVKLFGASWKGSASVVIRRDTGLVYQHPRFGLLRTSPVLEAQSVVRLMSAGDDRS